jgi:hypothetical protein
LHAFLSSLPHFRPLDDDGRSVCGLAAEQEYRALAEAYLNRTRISDNAAGLTTRTQALD